MTTETITLAASGNITQSNEMTMAAYFLPLQAKRLLWLYLRYCKKFRENNQDLPTKFVVKVSEYQTVYGVGKDTASKDMKLAVDELISNCVTFHPIDGDFDVVKIPWLAIAGVKFAKGQWSLEFNNYLMPHIIDLSEKFTTYDLKEVATLKNPRVCRLYESLCQHRKSGWWVTTHEWLAERFMLPDSQRKSPAELMRTFIKPSLKQICQKTSLNVSVTDNGAGKYRFDIEDKKKA